MPHWFKLLDMDKVEVKDVVMIVVDTIYGITMVTVIFIIEKTIQTNKSELI